MIENLSIKMDNIDKKLDVLNKEMEEIWILIDEMKSDLPKKRVKKTTKKSNKIIKVDEKSKWKREVYKQAKLLIGKKSFRKKSDVLHYIYNYMRKNYGIVWEQDVKEYKQKFDIDYKPKTIDVLYNNKMYKSIFESILTDMVANVQSDLAEVNHG